MELNKFDGANQHTSSPLTPNSISHIPNLSVRGCKTELEFSKTKEHLSVLADVASSLLC